MIKFTIKELEKFFPNDDICLQKVFDLKYKNIESCPKCGKYFKYHKLNNLKLYSCQFCGNNIAPTAKTIFHKSSTSLKSWFYAIYLFSVSKNGVSAKELERQLGVTYKTAWRMANRIRSLFDENINPLNNIVEIDETYIGGKEKNKHKNKRTEHAQGRSIKTKIPVIGAIERKKNIIAKVVTNTSVSTIQPFIRKNINIKANIKTDEYLGYKNIEKLGYKHNLINHGRKQYRKGNTHTNTIEGFWSQLKRSLHGTYHSVSPKYLQNYVNEFSYRYNKEPIFFHLFAKVSQPFQVN